jgi:hypothetical protein
MVRLSTSISIAKSIVVLTLVGATFFFASCKGDSEAIVYLSDIKKTPGLLHNNSEVILYRRGVRLR